MAPAPDDTNPTKGSSMSNVIQLPVIAGVEITTDAEGRFNLNALHRASGSANKDRPSLWLENKQTKKLIEELSRNSRLGLEPVNSVKGGKTPGTFAAEQLAVAYANWISPAFYLKVINTFLDYKKGTLQPAIPQTLPEALRLAAELAEDRERLSAQVQQMKPKVEFHDKVVISEDAITVAEAAKVIGTGRNRLLAFLRRSKWVTRKNEPYQSKIESGLMDVKLSPFEHPTQGLQRSVTPLITGKGLAELQRIHRSTAA